MEYRQLPHGKENEKFSVIGLGLGGIGQTPAGRREQVFLQVSAKEDNHLTVTV